MLANRLVRIAGEILAEYAKFTILQKLQEEITASTQRGPTDVTKYEQAAQC